MPIPRIDSESWLSRNVARGRLPAMRSGSTRAWVRWIAVLAWVGVGATGCGGDGGGGSDGGGGPDAAADGSMRTDGGSDGGSGCSDLPDFVAPGDSDGHTDPLGVASGEVRAGRLKASELPEDPKGLQLYEAGDFVLANDTVAVIIEDAGISDLYDPWGGNIIGIASVEDGRLVRPADYTELLVGTSRFILEARSVGVVADGSSGVATVRALGVLRPIPFLKKFPGVEAIAPGDFDGIEAAIDYTLRPDSPQVEVSIHYRNVTPEDLNVQPFFLIFQKERMKAFTQKDGRGFDVPDSAFTTPRIGFVSTEGTSYSWGVPEGEMALFISLSGTMVFRGNAFSVPACSVHEQDYARLIVGGPEADGLVQAQAVVDGVTLRAIEGTVTDEGGAPLAGVHVHVTDESGNYLTRATTSEDGTYTVHVPDGAAVRMLAYLRGYPADGPYMVGSSESSRDFSLGPVGRLRVRATDADSGNAIPVRIQVMPVDGPPVEDRKWGESRMIQSRLHVAFPANGEAEFVVPVGTHRVVVSRGFEYTLFDDTVMVTAGAETTVNASLRRTVASPGLMCADFHIHTIRSPDAPDPVDLKVRAAAGDGLEIPVRSEHEWVADFEPTISSEGLEGWLFGVSSLELTTFAWGHMGVFPLYADPSQRNHGAFEWVDKLPPEVFREVRMRPESPAIIINHPRSFGGGRIGSYFVAAELDPETGSVGASDMWDEDFKLVEVFNDSSFDENRDASVKDWFALLRTGRKVFAVGSSDSHKILAASPVGYPRTCLDLGVDTAPALRVQGANLVRDTALGGAMTIQGGALVTAVADRGMVGPGGTVTGASDTEDVHVVVQAPCWVSIQQLEVIVDGATAQTIDISDRDGASCTSSTRFDDTIQVDVDASGSWVLFHAKGDTPLDPVFPARLPFGVTNPIFFER